MKIYALGDTHLSFSQPVDPLRWNDVETYLFPVRRSDQEQAQRPLVQVPAV